MRSWLLYACLCLAPAPMLAQSAHTTLRCIDFSPVECTNAATLYHSIVKNAQATSALVTTATPVLNTNAQIAYNNILSAQSVSSGAMSEFTNFVASCQGTPQPMCSTASTASANLAQANLQLGNDLQAQARALGQLVNAIQVGSPMGQFRDLAGFESLNTIVKDLNNLNGTVAAVASVIASFPPDLAASQKMPVSSSTPSTPQPNAAVPKSPVAPQKGPAPSKK